MKLTNLIASFISSTRIIAPKLFHDELAIFDLGSFVRNFLTEYSTFSASSWLSVIRIAWANSSCSAWDKRSIATWFGLADLSQTIKTSEGPAIESIPT